MNRYGYSSIGRFDVFFRDQLLVFQQHQDESLYDSWTPEGDLRKFSDIEAWVQVPRCMAWLYYDEHVDSLSTMDNDIGVTSPESTTQTLPSFEEYTPPMTYPEEVEKTLGTSIEVEPSNETKLEEVGLNCNHNTPLSSREVLSFDGPEPQPLLNSPSLDVCLGDVIGPKPPIKPHSSASSRMKVVDYLTTQTPPSPHMEKVYPLGVDISNWEMFDNDWGLESNEVSPLGEELSLFDRVRDDLGVEQREWRSGVDDEEVRSDFSRFGAGEDRETMMREREREIEKKKKEIDVEL
ncbi:hypothetical protein Tco_1248295, partial [Tanacetum coccineum]